MTERIAKLTELVLAGKMYPEVQRVQYDRCDLFLEKHARSSKRIYEYVTAQKPVLTEYSAMTGLFVFDGTVEGDWMSVSGLKNIGEALDKFYNQPLDDLATFEWQHATANYNAIIRKGIIGLILEIRESMKKHADDKEKVEFLTALEKTAHAMRDWAHKCSREAFKLSEQVEEVEYKANLQMLSEALLRVPEHPATTFYEAVLSIYILFSYDPDSIGTLDRTLYDFYIRDLESGKITRDKAKEYLQELFLMLQSRTPRESDRFTKGGESHFCIGGYLPSHEDGFSDLSMLILEAMTELPTYIPQVSLRWTKKLPHEIFKKVLDFERNDPHKRIAFVNDEVKIAGFTKHFPFEIACAYSTVGCNECAFPGGFVGGTTNSNGLRSMQNTFFNRRADIVKAESFDDFFEIYKQELCADIDLMLHYGDCFNLIRSRDTSYVSSLLFSSCIEKALPLSQGPFEYATAGTGFIGITNCIDSLAIVKQFVYDEKRITMDTLCDALEADWVGYEKLHSEIVKYGKFFGNDDETSNYVARLLTTTIYDHMRPKRSIMGYPVGIGNLQGYNHHHKYFGSLTKATPDGRHNGEMLKFGIGQSGGYDRNGLTALLSSVAKCDPMNLMNGSNVTNIYLDTALVRNDDNFDKLVTVLESYFKMGGNHFQLNYISKEELKKAKIKPQEHKSLRVRVSGFSDYFVNLSDPIQDDIIARTEHTK